MESWNNGKNIGFHFKKMVLFMYLWNESLPVLRVIRHPACASSDEPPFDPQSLFHRQKLLISKCKKKKKKTCRKGNLAFRQKLHVIIKLHLQNRNCTHYCTLDTAGISSTPPSTSSVMTSHWLWISRSLLALCGWHWGGMFPLICDQTNGTEWKNNNTKILFTLTSAQTDFLKRTYSKQSVFKYESTNKTSDVRATGKAGNPVKHWSGRLQVKVYFKVKTGWNVVIFRFILLFHVLENVLTFKKKTHYFCCST